MEIDPNSNDVFQLLKQLKEANGAYPPDLLALRRQGYLKQVAEVGVGGGLALGLKDTLKSGKGAGLPPAAGTLLEGLLVVAIIAEASMVAYLYRDRLAEFFQNFSNQPKVEEVANPPIVTSPIPDFEFTISPVVTETVIGTETATPLGTSTLLAGQPTHNASGQDSSQTVSTAVPNGNNGNQYGLTPKPERTTEPGNNSENNPDRQADSKRPH